MDFPELYQCVEQILFQTSGKPARIASSQSASGGCINAAQIVTLDDQRQFFIKSNHQSPDLFSAESNGLAAIAATDAIRVPEVIGVGKTESGIGFLILEVINTGKQPRNFWKGFGRSLAQLHNNRSRCGRFGFDSSNHIGSSPQINAWKDHWVEFWGENRLRVQLRIAIENGFGDSELSRLCDQLISKLEHRIGAPDERPSLLHGDLWSGNLMVSDQGQPVLIDPAVYFGSRESEFGMTTLFGGFSSEFYHAYNEVWPLCAGWKQRVEIYKLYHLMNHLNLFGSSYLGGCLEILRRFS